MNVSRFTLHGQPRNLISRERETRRRSPFISFAQIFAAPAGGFISGRNAVGTELPFRIAN